MNISANGAILARETIYIDLVSSSFSSTSVGKQLDFCTYCPKMCRHACPVSTTTGRETLTPQTKMSQLNQLRLGRQSWTDDNVDPLWACTGCRQCTTYCEHGNEPGLVLMAGRARAVAEGASHPGLADYPKRFRTREVRLVDQLSTHVSEDRLADAGAIGFWPGCDAVDKGLDDIDATLSLFDRVGADEVKIVDANVACAGYPLLAGGLSDMFRWHANKAARTLERFGTVIVNCSACVYAIKALYPAEGISVSSEILSLSEFLAQSIARAPDAIAAPTNKKTVYYHDPCYLARYEGIVEAPRTVLQTVADVREFAWSHADTECCGGGGLLPKTMPDVADAMARRRLREVAKGGGGTVVTSCGTCAFMLKSNAPSGVDVCDLPTAVWTALSNATD